MVTGIKELEKHQINRDMVSVLDFRLIEVKRIFYLFCFPQLFLFQIRSPVFCSLTKINCADLTL